MSSNTVGATTPTIGQTQSALAQSTTDQSANGALVKSMSGAPASTPSAIALSMVPTLDFFFPNTPTPLIQHGSFMLSGQDCIALARMIDLLSRCGFTPANDPRFASLVALWTFVHRYHRNALSTKLVLSQQSKSLEQQLTVKTGLFTPTMHKQLLLQMKCASIVWLDQHILNQMNQGIIHGGKEIPANMLEILRPFTKPNFIPSLNSVVDPATQQSILNERKLMIQNQCITASGGNISPALASAIAAGGALSGLTADPTIHYFQQTSMHSLAYPPNQKQLDAIPGLVGAKFASTDPCTLLSEVLYGANLPPPAIDVRIVKQERDRIVKLQMKQRKEEIDQQLHEIRDSDYDIPRHTPTSIVASAGSRHAMTLMQQNQHTSNQPPAWMEIDSLALGLVPLQKKTRAKILRALPLDVILKDAYRSRRDVEANQRIRDKAEKKTRLATEKHLKKTRRNYLNAITNHCRDFQMHHRELHKKLCKNVCAAIAKYFEEKEKRMQDHEKSQEKARLALLKSNDEDAYFAMLKEAKNERLLNLIHQTDAYMDQLAQQIAAEQDEHAAKHSDNHHRPMADGHIPTAGEITQGNVFSSSTSSWKKTDAQLLDEAQEETPEQADRRRMAKLDEEERRNRMDTSEDGPATAAKPAPIVLDEPNGAAPAAGSSSPNTAATPAEPKSSRKLYYSLAHKKSEEIVQQPKMLKGGNLRSYQLEGLQWLVSLYNNQLNGILADEMGLGKTVQSLSLIAYLMEVKHNYGPFLIIVPMSTLHNNWEFECDRWLPGIAKVVYDGDKDRRRYLRENFIKPGHFNIVMTTFEFAMRDKAILRKIPWAYIIIDEAHRLKNPSCKLAQELTTYPKESRRVALTGTPLQNELHELWSLLNFLHPSIFASADTFEKWFATPFDRLPVAGQDKEKVQSMNEEEKLLVINRLHAILRPFMLRREKSSVETDLADKIEKVLRCELTPMQKAMYEAVLEGKVTMHNRIMQLRKICNHPILFHPYLRGQAGSNAYTPDETMIKMCGKFTLLDQILHKLKRTGHKVLIFNQMTKVMDILEEYCHLRKFTFLRLDGSTAADIRTESVNKFNAPDSPYFIFMLSTKAGGLGLNLQAADTVILFDSDWNPSNDSQAMARSHRIGQRNQVVCLRFITTATVEEKVLSTATTKLSHEQMVIQAGMFHTRYSHNASRAIAAEAMAKESKLQGDTGDDEDELWTDDFISRTLARSDEELVIFQEMDAQAKRSEAAGVLGRGMPENKMPKWCWDWCIQGPNATSMEQALVPFSEKALDAARAKIVKTNYEDPLNPKARTKGAAIVEVNTSDEDDYDVVAEASGVNDAALAEDGDRPLNYDDIDGDGFPSSSATPVPKKIRKSTANSAPKKRVSQPSKRKREEDLGDEPERKRKKASTKKAAAVPSTSPGGFEPLNYDAVDDSAPMDYSSGPTIAATSSGGIKLVIRGGTPNPPPKKIPKKVAPPVGTGPILINKGGNSLSFSLKPQQ